MEYIRARESQTEEHFLAEKHLSVAKKENDIFISWISL